MVLCKPLPAEQAALAHLRFGKVRVLRTARVQLESRGIGDHIYHPSGAHAALRNAIMRAKTPDDWYDTLAWIYGGNGLNDPIQANAKAA